MIKLYNTLFRAIENGLFVVQFASLRDKNKVLAGLPWTFDQSLVLLQEIEDDIQPSHVIINLCPFWIRLYNLPLRSRSDAHVRLIGGCLGTVLDLDSDGIGWDKSARIRVLIDVTQPLRRVQRISLKNGASILIEIKYERLPTFCYACEILGHIERDCLNTQEEEREEERQWGSWLRASPRRGRQKIEEETKAFLRGARSLDFHDKDRVGVMGSNGEMKGSGVALKDVVHDQPQTTVNVAGGEDTLTPLPVAATVESTGTIGVSPSPSSVFDVGLGGFATKF